MRPLVLSAGCLLATLAQAGAEPIQAGAEPLRAGGTTYVEPSLNRSGTLVIEHPPVPASPYGRRNGQAAIAGFCRDGGIIRRRDAFGHPLILRQREVCDSLAPRTLTPGAVDPRPAWPAEGEDVVRRKALRAKG